MPDCLRRASGESVYVPHGASRYATHGQLALEDRLLADAQETGAPRLNPRRRRGCWAPNGRTCKRNSRRYRQARRSLASSPGSGLRLDQAAAAFAVLTSARRAEVMAGPAGSGKTRTVAQMARPGRRPGWGR